MRGEPAPGRRNWGWHPLDPDWAARIVGAVGIAPGELVLDIGAGTGALTLPLLERGVRVVAVELHPERAAVLRQRFAGRDIVVVRADAADLRLPRRPFRVVSSPPYGVTTALVRRLVAPGSRLWRADLVLQRQAAQRLSRESHRFARGEFDLSISRTIPRRAFRPPPKVDSVLLTITRRR